MYRRLATNTVVNILNLAFNIVINFALAPVFIRALGDEAYGVWVFVASLSVLRGFLRIFDLGIAASIVKYVAEYNARDDQQGVNEVVSASLIVYSIVGLVVSLILLAFGLSTVVALFHIPASQIDVVRILLVWLALQTIADFLGLSASGTLEGLQRYDITRGSNIVRLLLFAATSIFLLNVGWGVYALALATSISEVARIVIHIFWIRRLMPGLHLTRKVSQRVLRAIFSLSSKVFVFALANIVYEQMDKLIISAMLTTTLLTDYDISNRLHTLVFALTTIIGPFVVPMASSLQAKDDSAELRRLLIRATLYTGMMTVPTALVTIILARPLTIYWLGDSYQHTVLTTQVFISYLLFWFMLRAGQNMLIGINRLNVVLPAFILGTVTNLIVSVALADRLGVIGVVFGTITGNLLICWPYFRAFHREFGITLRDLTRGIVLRLYPQSIVAALAVWAMSAWREPRGLIEVGIYGAIGLMIFAVLFYFAGMPSEERAVLQRYFQRVRRMGDG